MVSSPCGKGQLDFSWWPSRLQCVIPAFTGPDREKSCEGPCCVWHAMEPNLCGLPQASCSLLRRDNGVFVCSSQD